MGEESLEVQARSAALEVIQLIRGMLPSCRAELTPQSLPRLLGAAALARMLCLLEAMIAVCEAGQARVAGLIFRAQWETQLVGTYCMLDGDGAVKALAADRAYWAPGIERTWTLGGTWYEKTKFLEEWYPDVKPRRMNFAELAGTVERLLKEKGYPADMTTPHHRLYKGESTFTAHPGFEALIRHLKDDGDAWTPDVEFGPIPSQAAYIGNCAFSAACVAEPLLLALSMPLDKLNGATAKLAEISVKDSQRNGFEP